MLLIQIIISYAVLHFVKVNISDNFFKYITYIFPIYRVFDLFYGMVLWKYISNIKDKKFDNRILFSLDIIAFGLLILVLILKVKNIIPRTLYYDIVWIPATLFLISVFYLQGPVCRIITNPISIFVGDNSSNYFILHYPIIILMESFFGKSVKAFPMICLVIIIGFNYIYNIFKRRLEL